MLNTKGWEYWINLPEHAPTNAVFGRYTNYRSFLGGSIIEWADHNGYSLGESNAVPDNPWGEGTIKGSFVAPGRQVISGALLVLLKLARRMEVEGFPFCIGGEYLEINDNVCSPSEQDKAICLLVLKDLLRLRSWRYRNPQEWLDIHCEMNRIDCINVRDNYLEQARKLMSNA
jgi:hypothetical protein